MTPIDQTITEFGQSMGMSHLQPDDSGSVVLDISGIGVLSIELVGDREEVVAVSLSRSIEPPDAAACQMALELTHYRQPGTWPVRTALADGRSSLLFAARMQTHEFTLPALHEAIGQLETLQDAMSPLVRPA
jgi:type III secretion system chaperone SycN